MFTSLFNIPFLFLSLPFVAIGSHNAYHELASTPKPAVDILSFLLLLVALGHSLYYARTRPLFYASVVGAIGLAVFAYMFLMHKLDIMSQSAWIGLVLVAAVLYGVGLAPTSVRMQVAAAMVLYILLLYSATVSTMKHNPYYVLAFLTLLYMSSVL